MELARGDTAGMLICSSLSILASLSIMAPIFLFSEKKLGTLDCLALSNLLTAAGSMVGEPINKSITCYYEGIITNIFTLSSVLWTVLVSYQMWYVIRTGKLYGVRPYHHIVCWGIPIIVTFLPFVNTTYGAPDGLGWCWIVPTSQSPVWAVALWYWVSFYGIVWASIFVMMALLILSIIWAKQLRFMLKRKALVSLSKLQMYPVILAICWGITSAYDSTFYFSSWKSPALLASISNNLPCLQGFLTAVVFWSSHPHTRQRVYRHFVPLTIPHSSVRSKESHVNAFTGTSDLGSIRGSSKRILNLSHNFKSSNWMKAKLRASRETRWFGSKNPKDAWDDKNLVFGHHNHGVGPAAELGYGDADADAGGPDDHKHQHHHGQTSEWHGHNSGPPTKRHHKVVPADGSGSGSLVLVDLSCDSQDCSTPSIVRAVKGLLRMSNNSNSNSNSRSASSRLKPPMNTSRSPSAGARDPDAGSVESSRSSMSLKSFVSVPISLFNSFTGRTRHVVMTDVLVRHIEVQCQQQSEHITEAEETTRDHADDDDNPHAAERHLNSLLA